MDTKRVKNKIVVSGIAAALMVGFGASMAPAAYAGALSGDCATGTTYNAGTRTCTGMKVETANYRYNQKMPVTVSWSVDQGSDAQTEAKRRPEAVGASSITNATRTFTASDTVVDYSASYAYPKVKVATPAGWTDNGTMWERTVIVSSAPIVEREDTSSESAAIQAVMGATTSSQGSSLLATATSAHGGLILQSSKDALAGSLSAAQAHVSDLQAAELAASTESQKRTAASNAIKAVGMEITYDEANVRLESARTAFNSLNATSKAALQSAMSDAVTYVAVLKVSEADAANAAVKLQVAVDAIAAVMDAVTFVNASEALIAAEVAYSALGETAKVSINSEMSAARAHVSTLAAIEGANAEAALAAATDAAAAAVAAADSATRKSVDSASATLPATVTPSADSTSGGSLSLSRAVSHIADKILFLAREILSIKSIAGPALNILVIASAEMNALAEANPAVVDANLQAEIDAANKHVAELMGNTEAEAGSVITVESVLVGRGENKASDAKHFAAVKKALAESKDIILVTISADKDWSKAKRASYQKKMVDAAKAAGFTADQIRVVKPRPVETVSLYAFSPGA